MEKLVVGQMSSGHIYVGDNEYHNNIVSKLSVIRFILIEVDDVDKFLLAVNEGTISVDDLGRILNECITTYYMN